MLVRPAKSYTCFDINGAVKLRVGERGASALIPITVSHFFRKSCKKYASQPALRYERMPGTHLTQASDRKWTTVSYAKFAEKVEKVARMLINFGLRPRDVVGIIAFNSPEWLYTQFGTILAGGIVFGAHITSSEEAIEHMLKTASAAFCIVENAEQMAKVRAVRGNLPELRVVIQLDGTNQEILCEEKGFYFWDDLMAHNYDNCSATLQERERNIYVNECVMLLYTSGTTGLPKAVMLSHDNLMFNTRVTSKMFSHFEQTIEGSVVSYLPLCHIVGQIFEVFLSIQSGACIHFAQPNAFKGTLIDTLQSAKPTHFFGVPRILEKLGEHIQRNENQAKDNGRVLIGMESCRALICGGAPLTKDLKDFFRKSGMLIINCYGLSETSSGVTFNFDPYKESIGKVIDGIEIKIEPRGLDQERELCFRGRTIFMGYLNEPKKTNDSIDLDGWFHTGDAGYLDSDGYAYITARIKELVVTSGGENIPPVRIEELIKKELPAISNAMVVGDKRKFLSVLLTIKTKIDQKTGRPLDDLDQKAIQWLSALGFEYRKLSEVLNIPADFDGTNYSPKVDPKILASIEAGIQRANAFALLKPQRVQKFALLPHDFSLPTEELGPTFKLRRSYVMKKYEDIINKLYQ